MVKRIDIVCDIETLGKGQNPPVFQIAAVAFDILTGETIKTFNGICDIENINNIEGDTLKWWLKINPQLLFNLLNTNDIYTDQKTLVDKFLAWITEFEQQDYDVYFWGNGILFDNRIIQAKCVEFNYKYPIFYRNDRDMRTLVDIAAHKQGLKSVDYLAQFTKPYEEHNAINDAMFEKEIIVNAWQEVLYG